MQVPNPNMTEVEAGRTSIYDTWKAAIPDMDDNGQATGEP